VGDCLLRTDLAPCSEKQTGVTEVTGARERKAYDSVMVLRWTAAVIGMLAAIVLCIRWWRRWQSKAEALLIVRAIDADDTEELRLLWAHRSSAEAVREWFGDPALVLAVRQSTASVRVLLSLGADVDECGVGWMTALMHAAGAGDVELCRLLLDYGADPSACDGFGRPAAWWAESAGHDRLARMLRAGSSPEVR